MARSRSEGRVNAPIEANRVGTKVVCFNRPSCRCACRRRRRYHVALVDANDNKTGTVGAEIPPGQHWCKLRDLVFNWTTATFPLKYPTKSKLTLRENHVITVMGKAFYDIDHAPKNRSNQRPKPFPPGYAVWEIHPVTGLRVER
jgi:hypothetical protein